MILGECLEGNLREETQKWLEKAEGLIARIEGDEDFLVNIHAYINDSHYFLDKGDLIRAFESIIWAWAWMEIGMKLRLLQEVA